MPLQLRRSRAGIIILTLFVALGVGLLVYFGRPTTVTALGGRQVEVGGWTVGLFARVGVASLLLAYCIKRIASSRYVIEIDERGILDGAIGRPRIPWSAIVDLSCETTGDAGALKLVLEGREEVRIDLDGIRVPLQTVFSSAQEYWRLRTA